jgi:hypothetical protein
MSKPIVTYGCEIWSMTKRDKVVLKYVDRNTLMEVYGTITEQRKKLGC